MNMTLKFLPLAALAMCISFLATAQASQQHPHHAAEARGVAFRHTTTPRAAVATERTLNTVLVDFGEPLTGYARLHGLKGRGRVAVFYGNTRESALDTASNAAADRFVIRHSQPTDWPMAEARTFRYAYVVHEWPSNITVDAVTLLVAQAPQVQQCCAARAQTCEANNRRGRRR